MIYVISDIHGNSERFDNLLNKLNLNENDTLYVLGDVIDRGRDGIKLLRRIMKMPNVKMALGNHEYMMLASIGRPYNGEFADTYIERANWLGNNGGDVTYQSFLALPESEREEIVSFLLSLPLEYEVEVNGKKYKLCHACPVSVLGDVLDGNTAQYAVWERLERWEPAEMDTDYTIICGHTPTMSIERKMRVGTILNYEEDGIIYIDCGCAYPNGGGYFFRLGCICLENKEEFYSDLRI